MFLFSFLFIGANPDLVQTVSDKLARWIDQLEQWLIHTSPVEIVFLCFVAIVTVGLLRPVSALQELRDRDTREHLQLNVTSISLHALSQHHGDRGDIVCDLPLI